MGERELQSFFEEVDVMSSIKHPNIIEFIGATVDPPNLCIVTEYMPLGDLHSVLRKYPGLPWETKLSFALGIAKGMQYLHSLDPPIVHRDLKALNILVNENYIVKVADFGLSKATPEERSHRANTKIGTLNWLAPEVLAEICPYTTKADVFSYGMVLYEINNNHTICRIY